MHFTVIETEFSKEIYSDRKRRSAWKSIYLSNYWVNGYRDSSRKSILSALIFSHIID